MDVPATEVVSIGVRGEQSGSAMRQAGQRLSDWLVQNNNRYQRTGPVRVMGYNSPFVPRDRQFFEVQLQVKTTKEG